MITAEGRTDAGAAVTMLFPFYVGVMRPQQLPDGVAGPPEPERVIMINPLTQSMVLLPAEAPLPSPQQQDAGSGGGDESGEATETATTMEGLFDPFAALMREVMMMSAMEDRPGPPPASKASIEALKTVEDGVLAREAADAVEQGCGPQECAVCLEELIVASAETATGEKQTVEEGESREFTAECHDDEETTTTATASTSPAAALVVKEMPCGHRYHGDCIEKWLCMHGSCPVCRYRMPEEDKELPKKPTPAAASDDRPAEARRGFWFTAFGLPSRPAASGEDASGTATEEQQQQQQ